GKAVVGEVVSPRALALAEEAMRPIFGGKLVCLALALTVAAGGAGLAACGTLAGKPLPAAREEAHAPAAAEGDAAGPGEGGAPAVARHGDPLRGGAVARLGTVRFRHGVFMTKVAFARGGKVLASLGGDLDGFDIRLWDATSGRLLRRLPKSAGGSSLAISP